MHTCFQLTAKSRISRSFSIRLLILSWWMFVSLITACYSANLAATLTVQKFDNGIKSVEELLREELKNLEFFNFSGWSIFQILKNICFLHTQKYLNIHINAIFFHMGVVTLILAYPRHSIVFYCIVFIC